jgi:ribosomal protein S18 acetylase RimI-like enzyme
MIIIQRAAPRDIRVVTEIGVKSFWESHGKSAPAEDIEAYVSKQYDAGQVLGELTDQENIFHIVYYKGRAAGLSKMIFNQPHPLVTPPAVTKLERLYLVKEFYGLKLGQALFDFIKSLSEKEGQAGMWLFTWVENLRAVSFYKKNGFEIVGSAGFRISATHSNPNHVMYLAY